MFHGHAVLGQGCCCARRGSTTAALVLTVEPQLQFIVGRRLPSHGDEANPHGPYDVGDSPVVVHVVVDVPVVQLQRVPQVMVQFGSSAGAVLRGESDHGWDDLRWGIFFEGPVHRDTAPTIRCMRWRVSTETCVIHLVRTTTTTTHTRPVKGAPVFARTLFAFVQRSPHGW